MSGRVTAGIVLIAALASASVAGAEQPAVGGELRQLLAEAKALETSVRSDVTSEDAVRAKRLAVMLRRAGGGYFPGAEAIEATGDASGVRSGLSRAIRTLESAVGHPAPPETNQSGNQADEEREALAAILASRAYSTKREAPSLSAVLIERIVKFLQWVVEKLLGYPAKVIFASQLYLLIILGVILAVAAYFIVKFARERAAFKRTRGTVRVTDKASEFAQPEAHRRNAARLIEEGGYREACRQIMLALLAELEQMRLVANDRSMTNREYVTEFGSRVKDDGARAEMRGIVRSHDARWYGGAECTRTDATEMSAKVDDLVERTRLLRKEA
jgi:hypothetical protein